MDLERVDADDDLAGRADRALGLPDCRRCDINVNVDGVCVHQIRLQNVGGADFDALKANAMPLPHLVPIGDVDAFKRYVASASNSGSGTASL